jgi:hypothetical protein
MRRPLVALSAALGGLALWRWFSRAGAVATTEPSEPAPEARAEELRRKLAESRPLVAEREEFEGGETPVDAAEAPREPDERRREVHEEGRSTVERMRRTSPEG